MKKLFVAVAVLGIFATPAFGQANYFKGKTAGALAKVGTGGVVDEATTGTATSTVHAATLNTDSGTITTESLTTAAGSTYTFTLTNSKITAASKVFVSVDTASAGTVGFPLATPASGSCTIKIKNTHATAAFDNTFKISFFTVQ